MHLTDLEKMVIENIALNLYTAWNGQEPEDYMGCSTWANCVDQGPNEINSVSIPGAVGSLTKKGLVDAGNGEYVNLTPEGFAVYKGLPSYAVKFSYDAKLHEGVRKQQLLKWFPELEKLIKHFGDIKTLNMECNSNDGSPGEILIQREGR